MKSLVNPSTRSNSALEILRIFLLAFLLITHWPLAFPPSSPFYFKNWLDTQILRDLSQISVPAFAALTGLFCFDKPSLLLRNISRLMFVMLFSVIFAGILMITTVHNPYGHDWATIVMGGPHAWYLYSILILYWVAPPLGRFFKSRRSPNIPLFFFIAFFLLHFFFATIFKVTFSSVYNHYAVTDLIRSPFLLLSMACLSYYIKLKIDENAKWIWSLWGAIPLILIWVLFKNLYPNHANNEVFNSLQIISFLGLSLTLLVYYHGRNFYCRPINHVVRRMYFVYEYHWYFQLIFTSVILHHLNYLAPHTTIYLYWPIVFGSSAVLSIFLSLIQDYLWSPLVDPALQKLWNQVKKPFVIQK